MRESKIESHVVQYAKMQRCLVYKLHGKNDPDRLFVAPDGHVFFIEFKAPNVFPRFSQLHEHKRIEEYGHPVYVVDNREYGEWVVNRELDLPQ